MGYLVNDYKELRVHQSALRRLTLILGLLIILSGCGGSENLNQPSTSIPRAPTGVIAVVGEGQVTLSWIPVSTATSYNIYRSTTTGVSKATGAKISEFVLANSFADTTGLVIGETYYYVVTAVNGNGESAESAQVSAAIPLLAPPFAVTAVAGDGMVTLSWSSVPFATSYNIYRGTSSGVPIQPANKINATPVIAAAYTDLDVTNGTTYYYVVTSVSDMNETAGSAEVSAMPTAVVPAAVTISGTIRYEDKEYDVNGFTGNTTYKAVRFASVEVVDAGSNAVIPASTGVTDSTGTYSILFSSQSSTIYVRVNSSATLTPGHLVNVKDLSSAAALYGVPSSDFVPAGDATVNINIPVTNAAAGAFNILDVYVSGFQFVQSLSGTYPPALTAYWQVGNANGTYFCTAGCLPGAGIYVFSHQGDTDEFDDDVLWHEFGHFTASNFSWDDSPGGAHYLTSNDLDLRLSWSEGWGDFFPGAVKSWLKASYPELLSTPPSMPLSQYVDTIETGAGISININSSTQDPYVYASSEIAVAKVLWNLMGSYDMSALWNVVTNGQFIDSPYQVNLETFWDGWLLRPTAAFELSTLQGIFSERKIDYKVDSFGSDGSSVSASSYTSGTSQIHTLYPAGDEDYVAFTVTSTTQPYTMSTSPARNGADTFITLLDSNTIITANDNSSGRLYTNSVPYNCDSNSVCHENTPDVLSSRISHTFTSPGTYYVKVTSSPNRPLSAGRYGSYTLTITSP